MKISRTQLLLLFLAIIAIKFVKGAPAVNDEDTASINDPCEVENLVNCLPNDRECEDKNVEREEIRKAICDKNPHCRLCDSLLPIETVKLNDEAIIVEAEIMPTLNPPSETEGILEKIEPIIIDAEDDERSKIEKAPVRLIEKNIIIENDNNEKQYFRGYVDPLSNITTIIRLTNLINNTNVINMPTTLNNTNINNIHIFNNKSSTESGKYGLGLTEEGPCCWQIKPGSCKSTTIGLKCRHKRIKVCGKQCVKKMINTDRSLCNHIPQWPYIICQQSQNPNLMPNMFYPPNIPSFSEYEDNEENDDFPLFPEDEELENLESGWVIMQEKCKIVSEDGLHITNCTDVSTEFDHPYARNSIDGHLKRSVRNIGRRNGNNIHQQQQMPYFVMQPVYFQPIPMYMPQFYSQQPIINSYQQQLPFPPLDSMNQYPDQPDIKPKTNPYRKSKKHNKKHPIITEHVAGEL